MKEISHSSQTALIEEFRALWTTQKKQKLKRWHDGFLRLHKFNNRMILYDENRGMLADMYQQTPMPVTEGQELEFEQHLVTIEEFIQTIVQDISSMFSPRISRRQHAKINILRPTDPDLNIKESGHRPKPTENQEIGRTTQDLSVYLRNVDRQSGPMLLGSQKLSSADVVRVATGVRSQLLADVAGPVSRSRKIGLSRRGVKFSPGCSAEKPISNSGSVKGRGSNSGGHRHYKEITNTCTSHTELIHKSKPIREINVVLQGEAGIRTTSSHSPVHTKSCSRTVFQHTSDDKFANSLDGGKIPTGWQDGRIQPIIPVNPSVFLEPKDTRTSPNTGQVGMGQIIDDENRNRFLHTTKTTETPTQLHATSSPERMVETSTRLPKRRPRSKLICASAIPQLSVKGTHRKCQKLTVLKMGCAASDEIIDFEEDNP